MGLFSKKTLKEAAQTAPNSIGCYKIYYNGLKYVGKAEYGLRHRFAQYYNGNACNYPSAQKIHEHRDEITVSWKICPSKEACRETERKWIEQYDPDWNERSGWGS